VHTAEARKFAQLGAESANMYRPCVSRQASVQLCVKDTCCLQTDTTVAQQSLPAAEVLLLLNPHSQSADICHVGPAEHAGPDTSVPVPEAVEQQHLVECLPSRISNAPAEADPRENGLLALVQLSPLPS
jgi:hypothetical protein